MASQSFNQKTLKTFDSSHLFTTALKSFPQQSNQPPTVSLPLPPPPPVPSNFPPSNLIPNSRFLIDAFRHAGDYSVSYFLSHFHSDHYTGLTSSWSRGVVFCSEATAKLVVQVLKVSSLFVVSLPLRERITIDGCEVTLVDANHCPGAVQFLFKIPRNNGKFERYVHTGDFRFCDSMLMDPILGEHIGSDAIFLDTTYCNPKFVFPLQDESIDYVVDVIERTGSENEGSVKNVLFLVATYVIGKEKILLEIASRCRCKILVDSRKMAVLHALGYGESGVFTQDESESDVHVVGWNVLGETWPYFKPNFVKMKEVMVEKGYSKVVGFVPTGWTYEVKRNKFSVRSKDSCEIHLVPYSEHSNFNELREYVKFLRPKGVVPTVGSDIEKLDSKHANKMQKHFGGLVDETANKQEFLRGFHLGSSEMSDGVEKNASKDLKDMVDQEKEPISSAVENTENIDPCCGIKLVSMQELASQDPVVLNDEEAEKIIQELHGCLPTWVTRVQILYLINRSGNNVVEAVSNFYEYETEFHDQVFSSSTSISTSQTSPLSEPPPQPSKADSKKISPFESTDIPFSQESKSSKLRNLIKCSTSPAKRKRNTQNHPNKNVKMNSKLQSSGSKQSTITSYFGKTLPKTSQPDSAISTLEQKPKDHTSLSDRTRYMEEINQFIQIINGDESVKTRAAAILVKTKGDINKALDLYYADPVGELGENEKCLVLDGEAVQEPNDVSECSASLNKIVHGEPGSMVNLSVLPKLTEKGDANLVSLPSEKYNPIEHACWTPGQPAPYIHLARTFDLLEEEKGKIKATSILCNMFRSLLASSPEAVLPAVYLCTNKIAADHENMELNIGGSLVSSALEEACGTSRSKLTEMYNVLGDLGDVAQACRQSQRLLAPPLPLLIKDVFSTLRKISVQTGSGSTFRKKSLILNLLRSCREKEMKFLVRTLVRNLRIGAMLRTVLPALAQAVVINSFPNFHHDGAVENLKEKIQCISVAVVEAYNILPSLDLVVPSLMDKGVGFSSSSLEMVPGIPIKPMLAKITNGVPQALKLFENKSITCEYKYDGQRAQIHKLADGTVRIFSRNGDETTWRFPDLINIVKEACKPAAVTFILDTEVVAVDRKNGCKLMSFQELSSRGRGSKDSVITIDSIKVDICVFVFDVMLANGVQLLGLPLRHRRNYLKDLFCDERLGYFEYAKEITVEKDDACLSSEPTLTKISSFLEDAFRSSCEGIMFKSLDVDAGYCPSKRSDSWLKVKRDYVEELSDSLDLVPIGAWHGNGRKAGWYSPFLMACYNPETEDFQSVCRVMSGFSDAFYIEMKEFFSGDKILARKPPYYQTAEVADIWFSPYLVWQIRGADFTVSPVHRAAIGLVHLTRGISIRFPRFILSVPDRNPEECSTALDIAEMFNSQTRKMDVTVKK